MEMKTFTKIKKIYGILILILLFSNSCFCSEKFEGIKSQLQNIVNTAKEKFNISGFEMSILLADQNEPLIFISGKTKVKDGKKLADNSLFQVGSITKTFTALLVSKALEDRKITLKDKMGKFFPEYKKWENISIEQLIDQTSGIFDYIESEGWWHKLYLEKNKTWTSKELVDIAYKYPDYFSPGNGWRYSNTNYVMLGLILEKVNKISLSQQMNKLIKSVGLKNTFYIPKPLPNKLLGRMVHGYYDKSEDMTYENTSWLQSAGGIISTPRDLVKWISQLFNHETGLPKVQYLSLKQTKNGQEVTKLEQSAYSFGLFRMNTPEGLVWFTPGLTSGYTSIMAYVPRLDAFFAYSASNAPLLGLHNYMIINIIKVLDNYKGYRKYLDANIKLPKYSVNLPYSDKFIFPLN